MTINLGASLTMPPGQFPVPPSWPGGTTDSFIWGTIAGLSPLTVRLDGQSQPLPVTPSTLVNPDALTVGARVWVQLSGKRLIIIGVSGGTSGGGGEPPASYTYTGYVNTGDYPEIIGDGVTNDQPALQALIDAQPAGTKIKLAAGKVYALATRIVLHEGLTLDAYGAWVISLNGSPLVQNYDDNDTYWSEFPGYSGPSNIAVLGGTWDMRKDVLPGSNPHNCMTFGHASNITVRDVRVLNMYGTHALELHGVQNVVVDNFRSEGFVPGPTTTKRECIQIDSVNAPGDDGTVCRNIRVRGLTCLPLGSLGAYEKAIGSHSYTTNVNHSGILIDGVYCRGMQGAAIGFVAWEDVTIRNVVVEGCTGPVVRGYSQPTFGMRGILVDNVLAINCDDQVVELTGDTDSNLYEVQVSNIRSRGTSGGLNLWNIIGLNLSSVNLPGVVLGSGIEIRATHVTASDLIVTGASVTPLILRSFGSQTFNGSVRGLRLSTSSAWAMVLGSASNPEYVCSNAVVSDGVISGAPIQIASGIRSRISQMRVTDLGSASYAFRLEAGAGGIRLTDNDLAQLGLTGSTWVSVASGGSVSTTPGEAPTGTPAGAGSNYV